MELIFKTKKAEETYWRVKGLCFQFIYDYADNLYYEIDVRPLVEKLAKDLNSSCNITKAIDKLKRIFYNAQFAFDLPEHPEKHNGIRDSWKYEESVMRVFGFDFVKFHHVIS